MRLASQHEWRQTVARGVLRLSDSGPMIVDPEEIIAQDEIELDFIRFNATRAEKGFCFKPRKMACPFVDLPCYTCRNYGTTVAFLPEFKQMEADLHRQIERGKQAGRCTGWTRTSANSNPPTHHRSAEGRQRRQPDGQGSAGVHSGRKAQLDSRHRHPMTRRRRWTRNTVGLMARATSKASEARR